MHPVLESLGIKSREVPPGRTENNLLDTLLSENFFYNRCLRRLLEGVAKQVIEQDLHPLEKQKLVEKLIPARAAARAHDVRWSFSEGLTSGIFYISAVCQCGARSWWDCLPERISPEASLCGSKMPADLRLQYSERFARTPQLAMPAEAYVAAQQPRQETYSEMVERLERNKDA